MTAAGSIPETPNVGSTTSVARRSLLVLLYFGAVSAFGGGVLGVAANGAGVPLRYLDGSPFTSFIVPGIILGVVVGGTQLAAAILLHRRGRYALLLTVVAGFGMQVWIFVELAVIGEYSFLQTIYFALGVAELVGVLALLGLAPRLVSSEGRER